MTARLIKQLRSLCLLLLLFGSKYIETSGSQDADPHEDEQIARTSRHSTATMWRQLSHHYHITSRGVGCNITSQFQVSVGAYPEVKREMHVGKASDSW